MAFSGFPAGAFAFYEGLEADNSKTFWQANKAVYEQAVKGPFAELADALPDEFKPIRMFRPNRDVRFSADKSPYKTAAAAMGEREGGAIFYVQLSSTGLMAASGYYAMASDQLQRFREAVADDETGPRIEAITTELAQTGFELGAIGELKTAPRGYAKDHPRIALLRRKGLVAGVTWKPANWMRTAKALDRIEEAWRAAEPMNSWLDQHVGPSELPPDEAGWGR